MKTLCLIALGLVLAAPALAQEVDPQAANPASRANPQLPNATGNAPVLSPFQALGKIIQNPTRPPPAPPSVPVSGAPLPSAIPPDAIGTRADGR